MQNGQWSQYSADQIQQPIPNLRILNFTNFLANEIVSNRNHIGDLTAKMICRDFTYQHFNGRNLASRDFPNQDFTIELHHIKML